MSKDGSVTDYKYDDSGIRTSKTINGISTTYTTIDGRITSQTTNGSTVYYRYDADGQLLSLAYNGAEYFYVLNIQGDVIGLVDENGSLVVEYAYDAWGQITAISGTLANSVGQANPMRYRGYYWDAESGLYYLQSRYYNAEWGRFVNADAPEMLLSGIGSPLEANLFSYCNNNPVNYYDPDGHIAKSTMKNLGFLYLYARKYYLAANMWQYAFEGNGAYPKKLQSMIELYVWNSKELWDKVYEYVKQLNKCTIVATKKWSSNLGIRYTKVNPGMYYAIGNMNLYIYTYSYATDKNGKRTYYFLIEVSDTYDFNPISNIFTPTWVARQAQLLGWIKPYSWISWREFYVRL